MGGFDDILSFDDMKERIGNTVNHSFNLILFYYSIDERISFDESDGYSVQDIKYLVDHFMESLDAKQFKFILVATKLDSENNGDRRDTTLDGSNLSKEWNMPFVEVSSKNGTNIQKLLDLICKQHPKKQNNVKQESKESDNANMGSPRSHTRRRLTLTNNTFSYVETKNSFIGSLMGSNKNSFWNKSNHINSPKDDDAFFKSLTKKTQKVSSPKKTVKKRRVKPKGQRKFHKQKELNTVTNVHDNDDDDDDDEEAAVIVSGSPNVSVSALLKRNKEQKSIEKQKLKKQKEAAMKIKKEAQRQKMEQERLDKIEKEKKEKEKERKRKEDQQRLEKIKKEKEKEQKRLNEEKLKKETEEKQKNAEKNDIVTEKNMSVSAILKRNKAQNNDKQNTVSPKGRRKGNKRRKKKNIVFAELNDDKNATKSEQNGDNELAERLKQRKERQENERRQEQLKKENEEKEGLENIRKIKEEKERIKKKEEAEIERLKKE